MATRQKTSEMSDLDKTFDDEQKQLVESSNETKVSKEMYQNKILYYIYKCKITHRGPHYLNQRTQQFSKDSKSLNYSINLEIRLRKLTL